MFLKNFHIFIKKRAVLQQKFTVQVTTLADCDDITHLTVVETRHQYRAATQFSHNKLKSSTLIEKTDRIGYQLYICSVNATDISDVCINEKNVYRRLNAVV